MIFTFSTFDVSWKRYAPRIFPVDPMTKFVAAGAEESRETVIEAPAVAIVTFWPSVEPLHEIEL